MSKKLSPNVLSPMTLVPLPTPSLALSSSSLLDAVTKVIKISEPEITATQKVDTLGQYPSNILVWQDSHVNGSSGSGYSNNSKPDRKEKEAGGAFDVIGGGDESDDNDDGDDDESEEERSGDDDDDKASVLMQPRGWSKRQKKQQHLEVKMVQVEVEEEIIDESEEVENDTDFDFDNLKCYQFGGKEEFGDVVNQALELGRYLVDVDSKARHIEREFDKQARLAMVASFWFQKDQREYIECYKAWQPEFGY